MNPMQTETGQASSSCFLVMVGALFALGALVTLLLVLIRLPDHEEQVKMKKMLRFERAVTNREIAA